MLFHSDSNESHAEKTNISHRESVSISMSSIIPSRKDTSPDTEFMEYQKRMIGPAIGLSSYALCSFVLGLVNSKVLRLPYSVVGVAFTYGVIGQLAAGISEIFHQDVFNAVSFFTFSGFYIAYIVLYVPCFGVASTLEATGHLDYGVGLLCLAYTLPAFIFFLSTFRQPYIVRLVMLFTTLANLLAGVGALSNIVYFTMTSGWCSVCGSMVAWYGVLSLICNETNTNIKFPFL
ncbi:hypothetical protein MFLAVUS_005226 [Mucor flavus]|uniref:Uncharacterized protein n=1 Tax=Mucor flavus TaxID=439312 RepID=A0ABP9YY57_9FUNG